MYNQFRWIAFFATITTALACIFVTIQLGIQGSDLSCMAKDHFRNDEKVNSFSSTFLKSRFDILK